ncbi:conserved Plasmodium protein, unknown function [Plasmodium gallinaceum]|uniref:Uncharacterized protein n=1 Tax=Plasmodium gallinaceum TaxID=5849 RepID=A0A1J1GY32_PLAGA|nr:conserved Plasmodium protein, unknown function [Plasmodium gallinaceum]CRG97474.1 conserved Plasmodium protein, unknown function [Plasmodium gallinaceum]
MDIKLLNKKIFFRYLNKRFYINKAEEIVKEKSSNTRKNKFKNIYIDFSLNKYVNINSLNVERFIKTPIHYQKYKELVDTIKCVSNVRLQNIHLIRKIVNSLELYIINYLNSINYFNDLKDFEENFYEVDNDNAITINSVITILVSLYKLKYRNEEFLKLLEKYIFINKNKLKISQMHLILYIYSYFNRINKTFINSILLMILNNINSLNSYNILNIFTSLFYLNCKNEKTLYILTNYIISNKLNFDINIIIYILNNLKKLNYSNTNLMEYFHDQIILKLDFLNVEKNVQYVDSFFLKKNIQNIIDKENEEINIYENENKEYKNIHKNNSEIKKCTVSYDKNTLNNLNIGGYNHNFSDKNIDTYGSLHNKYIIENNYVDYIYEYYNNKDIIDKNKSKINLLMEVLIYYKYYKEDLLNVLYSHLLKNLKKYDKENVYHILSNIYDFEIDHLTSIHSLNKKLLLNLCHYYVPFYNKCNIIIFLFLKLILQKHNYFNTFVDKILLHKINTDILNLRNNEILNLLNEFKNSNINKYLCDISLIYFDFFKLQQVTTCKSKENNNCNNKSIDVDNNDGLIRRIKNSSENLSNYIEDKSFCKEKKIYIFEFNEKNRLNSCDTQFLLQLFFFYIEAKYYEGIFLFLKNLFFDLKDFKSFDPFLFYKINNYCFDLEKIMNLEEMKKITIYNKFNALQFLNIYEYFKNSFDSYEYFICKQDELVSCNHKRSMYYFYLYNIISINENDNDNFGEKENKDSSINLIKRENKNDFINDEKKECNQIMNKYVKTNSRINYISCYNKISNKYKEYNHNHKTEDNERNSSIDITYKNKKCDNFLEKNSNQKNFFNCNNKENLNTNKSLQFERNTFETNIYIYNILNNVYIYTPVDLFAIYINYYNSNNFFFLLENIVFKINYINTNYLSLVLSKIFTLLNKENCNKTKEKYILFFNFFHDYLLGEEKDFNECSHLIKNKEEIKNDYNFNNNEKRMIIDVIYKNCISKYDEIKTKKRIAYILHHNNYVSYANNDIIFNETFLSTFNQFILKKKYHFTCLLYNMTNESLFLILKSLRIKKKNSKYMNSIEIITNIFILRYIHCIYSDQTDNINSLKRNNSNHINNYDDEKLNIKDIKKLSVNLRLSLNNVNGKKDDKQINTNNKNINNTEKKNRNCNKKEEYDNTTEYNNNIDSEKECKSEVSSFIKNFIQIYYTIIKIRYFHEMPINKHIIRELCININYVDNNKFLRLLFYIYKYKFDEIKYLLMLQKKCFLYKDLYYTHSNYRIIEFLCKKLKINIDENIRTTPTKLTSYDYEK